MDSFLTQITQLIEHVTLNWDYYFITFQTFLAQATSFVGTFAVIASMTKNEADNRLVDAILRLINLLGFAIGRARPATITQPATPQVNEEAPIEG